MVGAAVLALAAGVAAGAEFAAVGLGFVVRVAALVVTAVLAPAVAAAALLVSLVAGVCWCVRHVLSWLSGLRAVLARWAGCPAVLERTCVLTGTVPKSGFVLPG